MQKVQAVFNALAAEHRAEIMQMRRERNREGLQELQDKLVAEAESKVSKRVKRRLLGHAQHDGVWPLPRIRRTH